VPAQSSMDFLTQTLASGKEGLVAQSSDGFLMPLPLAWGKESMVRIY
jgi:hypothetical protein